MCWQEQQPAAVHARLEVFCTIAARELFALQILHGAKQVVSVDCNPAQSALLEMKKLAIEKLDYEDVWQLFGEGKHPNFKQIFLTKLGPFMTEKSFMFWQKR